MGEPGAHAGGGGQLLPQGQLGAYLRQARLGAPELAHPVIPQRHLHALQESSNPSQNRRKAEWLSSSTDRPKIRFHSTRFRILDKAVEKPQYSRPGTCVQHPITRPGGGGGGGGRRSSYEQCTVMAKSTWQQPLQHPV